jgi:hypothetical protein
MDEDDMHVNWNGYLIGMSLKYDVSDIFNDIIKMIRALNSITKGEYRMTWPSSTFFAHWVFFIDGDDLKIESEWISIKGGKPSLEKLRKISNQVVIKKSCFIDEWKELLQMIHDDLRKVGYHDIEFPKIL